MRIENEFTLTEIFATPFPVELNDGNTYFIKPLSLQDTEDLDMFIKATYLREQKKLLDTFEEPLRQELLREILRDASKLTANSQFGKEYLTNNIECSAFFIYIHIRQTKSPNTESFTAFKENLCSPTQRLNNNVDLFMTAYMDMASFIVKESVTKVKNYTSTETDWVAIIHFLVQKGLTLDYIKSLTAQQIVFLLSKIEKEDPKFNSFAEVQAFLDTQKAKAQAGESLG